MLVLVAGFDYSLAIFIVGFKLNTLVSFPLVLHMFLEHLLFQSPKEEFQNLAAHTMF